MIKGAPPWAALFLFYYYGGSNGVEDCFSLM